VSDELGAIRALANAGLALARKASSGRMALARIAEIADPALLPADIRDIAATELATWNQTPEALSTGEVEKLLRAAWGEKPAKMLDDFEPEPVAQTVGVQIHRGSHDGRAVAVKILRPGLVELVRADLKLLETLAAPLRSALPNADPQALIREASERVLDELDLEHEGAAQRALARALRNAPGVHAPATITALTHPGVLVREWAEGTTLADGATVADPRAAARDLVRALVTAARAGTLHADPEPGNVVIGPDGGLALIDAGASARVPTERVDDAATALAAFRANDAQGLGTALQALGWLADSGVGERILAVGREVIGPFLDGPQRLDAPAIGARADVAWAQRRTIAALAPQITVPPQDLWPLRGIGGAGATLAKLGATHDWPALIEDALRG